VDDNIKDGIEDANHNGRIDGDNGDGIWAKLEIWIETDPYNDDTDGDGFLDQWEKDKKYNPLSIDTDRDGISDDDEDLNGNGYRDGDETSATKEDTDDDGLPDLLEKEGWKVTIIEENTKDITREYMVYSDPNEPDKDGDGLTDLSEYLNSTDPDDPNTDDDKFTDYEEITSSTPTLPWGIDGKPPIITEIKLTYDAQYSRLGPIRILSGYEIDIAANAMDPFGLENVQIEIKRVDRYRYCADDVIEVTIEKTIEVSMDLVDKFLFKGFDLNVSAMDRNNNLGFKNQHFDGIIEKVLPFGLLHVAREIGVYVEELKENVKSRNERSFNILKSGLNTVNDLAKTTIDISNQFINDGIKQSISLMENAYNTGEDIVNWVIEQGKWLLEWAKDKVKGIIDDTIIPEFERFKNQITSNIEAIKNHQQDINVDINDQDSIRNALLGLPMVKQLYNRIESISNILVVTPL